MEGDIIIPDRNLAGNPILLKLNSGNSDYAEYKIYRLGEADILVFEGVSYTAGNDLAVVDISNLFDPNSTEIGNYRVNLINDNDVVDSKSFIIYPGAVNKMFRRKLKAAGNNIFDLKLKNANSNFFLSTRTFNTELFIPENELMPLAYYAEGMNFSIKADEIILADINDTGTEEIRFIDLVQLRKECALTYKRWVNVFKIVSSGAWSCSVIITEAEATGFYLKFRNSLGAFEKIALYEEASYSPKLTAADQYLEYDSDISELTKVNNRNSLTSNYSFIANCENADKRLFLLDALLAKDTFISIDGVDYSAKFTADIAVLTATNMEPTTVNIQAAINDDENYYTPVGEDTLRVLTVNNKELTINNKNIVI